MCLEPWFWTSSVRVTWNLLEIQIFVQWVRQFVLTIRRVIPMPLESENHQSRGSGSYLILKREMTQVAMF